jgi:hypothetical protein
VLDCCKTAEKQITLLVPGTGHVDFAKSMDDQIHSWWIVREMPLDSPRPGRKRNKKGNVTLR